jgi:NAD(P)H-dependent flavin oxidoreductase YrpB (nitropropane dioxygenase family)
VKTRVAALLGVDYPIVAFSHCRDVVAAVTNAGGFGVLGAVAHSPGRLDIDLAWIDEQVNGRPYGIDLLLPAAPADAGDALDRDSVRQLLPAEQQHFVDEILARYGVPALPDGADEARPRMGVARDAVDALLEVAFAHPIRLVASALGAPPPALVERAHGAGALVAALAGRAEHAVRHRAVGADLIVAQGTEAGGHTGTVATMVLVPEVVDAVAPTPVLAAGGIARGRQIAAALALGAEGVWCGAGWLTTEEAETSPVMQRKFLAATSSDTVRSASLTGKPARMLRSAWTEAWEVPEAPPPLPLPLQTVLVTPAQQRINRAAGAAGSGAQQLATYFVGQVVGSLDRVRPVRQVMREMVTEYAETVAHLIDEGDW